jgi:hypothetical protein
MAAHEPSAPRPPAAGSARAVAAESPREPEAAAPAARVLAAVHAFLRAPSAEREEAMVRELRRATFLAVVAYDPPLPAGHDGRATIPAGTTMHARGRVAPDGRQLLAVYTDAAAVRKDLPGHPVRTTALTAEQVAALALQPPNAGAVLNPAGPYLELRATELRRIVPEAVPAG